MSVTLVHPEEQVPVAAPRLIEKCTLFQKDLTLVGAPYAVKSAVPIQVFREFLSALEGGAIKITNANFVGLSLLSTEFGFNGVTKQLSEFRSSAAFAGEVADAEARERIAALEEQARALREGQARLEAEAARASSAVEGLRAEVSALKARHQPRWKNSGLRFPR
jgi:hypothetical protein